MIDSTNRPNAIACRRVTAHAASPLRSDGTLPLAPHRPAGPLPAHAQLVFHALGPTRVRSPPAPPPRDRTGRRGGRMRPQPAHGDRQRGAGEQIDDVVLAEVDEREAERRRIARRLRPRPAPPRRAEARPSGMWRSEATASQPGDCPRTHCRASPSRLARSARRTRPSSAAHAAPRRALRLGCGGIPRRRRRHDPVEARAEVEHGIGQHGRAREARGVSHEHVRERSVRHEEPAQCVHTSTRSSSRHSGPSGPLGRARAAGARSAARPARAAGRPRSGSRCGRERRTCSSSCGDLYAARYAHICRAQTPTSRLRERRIATDRPTGAANATACRTTAEPSRACATAARLHRRRPSPRRLLESPSTAAQAGSI